MKFETEHGCVVSEMATAYGNSEQIGRYAIAAAMNEVLTQAERVDQMEIRVCAPLEEKKTHLYDVKAEAARCAREHGQTLEAKNYITEISRPIMQLSKTTWTGIDVVDVVIM